MRYVEVGGARLSVIGLGTWQFGSREWGYGSEYASTTAGRIVRRALDLGVNLLDTAEIYGLGRSERILGTAIADRRGDAFVATKILPVLPLAPVVEQRARSSLRRLGLERIDLYQVHWPNPLVGNGPTMTGMRRLLDAGLVRYVGVSNFPLERWQDAERQLPGMVLSNQVRFSLVDRRPLDRLVPWAQSEGRIVIAYSPLAQGLLGGRYDAEHPPAGLTRRANPLFSPENLRRASGLLEVLREVASAHDRTPAQVALAWVISHDNVVAIPGASSVEQLEANAAAADIELSSEERARLNEAAEAFRPERGVGTVAGSLLGAVRQRLGR